MKLDIEQLYSVGYAASFEDEQSDVFSMLESMIGESMPHSNGDKLFELNPRCTGPVNTFSEKYGRDRFPFHTDCAWLDEPPRYVVLRLNGSRRRPTHLSSFLPILGQLGKKADVAIFATQVGNKCRPVTIRNRIRRQSSFRWDEIHMQPIDSAGKSIAKKLDQALQGSSELVEIDWTKHNLLVFDNWNIAHSRGCHVNRPEEWIMQRMYIKGK